MKNKLISENGIYGDTGNGLMNIIMYVILQFPVSSMLKVYIGSLNLILTGLAFALFFLYYLRYNMKIKEFYLVIYIILTLLQNVCLWGFSYYENNMLFYFPFMILYFSFFVRNMSDLFVFMIRHRVFVDVILLIWNLMVAASLVVPSCYVYEGESRGFVSFAGSTFLLCAMAVYIFALLTFQYYIYKNKIYLITLIIPSLCILLGTTRTYLGVLICAWFVFLYINLKNKKWFIPVMIIASIILMAIVLVSPIRDKFINTSDRISNSGMDPLQAFTSGRSVFWLYDLHNICTNNRIKILFGNGVNYLFNLNRARFGNPLWAHNDYIQILSDYGLVGIGIYLYMFKYIIKSAFIGEKVSKLMVCIIVVMWVFNAFFNMFYTYFCAMLSFPFYLLIVKYDAERRLIIDPVRSTPNEKLLR